MYLDVDEVGHPCTALERYVSAVSLKEDATLNASETED